MKKNYSSKFLFFFFLFIGKISFSQIIYQHNFGTSTFTAVNPYGVAPTTIDANLSASQWQTSFASGYSSLAGSTGQALSISNSGGTPTYSLSFTVGSGFNCDITAFSFWRQRSTAGAQTWTLTVNGITTIGAGTTPTTGVSTGTVGVSNTVNGLSATVNVVLQLGGATSTGTFRLDDFTLYGTVYPVSGCTTPTLQASSFGSSGIGNNSAVVSWNPGSGGNVLVLARQNSAVSSVPTPGVSYTGNSVFSLGQQIGTGNYVVYNGSSSFVNVTGLNAATNYYFSVFEYNTTSGSPCYLTPGLTGSLTTIGTATGLQMRSVLVDACNGAGSGLSVSEPYNEMIFFRTGSGSIPISQISISGRGSTGPFQNNKWPNAAQAWHGLVQNSNTAAKTASLNSTIIGCGYIREPVSGIIPANSDVIMVASQYLNTTYNSFTNLNDSIYIVFQDTVSDATQGHFLNYNATSTTRGLAIIDNANNFSDTVYYDASLLINQSGGSGGSTAIQNGAAVDYDIPGNATYVNRGCQAPYIPLSVDAGNNVNVCFNSSAALTGTASGTYNSVTWTGGAGSFSNNSVISTTYTPGSGETGIIKLYCTISNNCPPNFVSAKDSVLLTILQLPILSVDNATVNLCAGQNATVTATSNAATYTWSPSSINTNTIVLNTTGVYTVESTNACGMSSATVNVNVTSLPVISVVSQTNVNCFAATTGTATVSASAGVGPYTYTWMPGNLSGASQTTLGAGTYTVSTTDAVSCAGSNTVLITEPTTSLSAVITATTAASCGASSVSVFWTETFGVGCSQNQIANGTNPSVNGAWAVTNTGVNDADANQWFISATESGMGVGICGDGCLGSGTTNRTLHISNLPTSPAAFFFCPTGDCGAAYDTGIGFNNVTADKRAESPTINCTGKTNITLDFKYIEGGQTTIDDATLWYFDGAVWAQIDNMPKTVVCGGSQGIWATRTVTLPVSADNNPSIKLGYRWVNNDDGAGSDPSFAVDDITLSASSGALGGATVTASGGTAGYTYSWSPSGGTTAGVNNLTAGNNTVTVTDSKGCTTNAIAIITSAGGPTLAVTSQTNVNCFSANTGTATVLAGGGTGPYTYTWMPGNLNGASQTTLGAGTYTISTTDAGSCVGSGTVLITQPTSSVSAVISSTTATGCGTSVGGATVTASGGTAGYTYLWAPSGGTTSGVNNLAAGNNTVTVTDTKGCTASAIAVITSAGGPTLAVTSQTNVNCFSTNTGTATVLAGGGTGPYTYTWMPGNLNGASQTNLGAGTYTISTTDAGSCIGSGTVLITQPTTSLSAVISATTTTGCGTSIGGATVTASGGTAGYTYLWAPSGGTTSGVNNLAAGNNTVTVTDTKGCTTTAIATIISSSSPTLAVTSQTNVNCFSANTGTATVLAGGGTGPYTYTWMPGNLNGASQTTLGAGTYTISTTDAGSCVGSGTVLITQPTSSVSAVISSTTATGCGTSFGGATVTASGGTAGYTYLWAPSGGSTAGVSNLAAGDNTVTVTDIKGCTVTTVANITTVGGPTLSVTSNTSTICPNETATLTVTGGSAPYTWSNSSNTGSVITTSGGLVSVSNTNICGTATATINIAVVNLSANITANPTTGTTPVTVDFTNNSVGASTYLWDFGNGQSANTQTVSSQTYSVVGAYTVYLLVTNGSCLDIDSLTIKVLNQEGTLVIPNVFTPNGDSVNDIFKVTGFNIIDFSCTIFDRWGLQMYAWDGIKNGWNGKTNDKEVPTGTYFYLINAKDIDGVEIKKQGTVSLFK